MLLRGCTVRNYNGDGISVQWKSENATVEDCMVEDNVGMGIHPGSDSHDSLIRRNIARHSGNSGLFVCVAVKHCRFEDNQLPENSSPGGSIGSRSTDNTFSRNRIVANAQHGIEFRHEAAEAGAHRNRFDQNIVLNNGHSETDPKVAVVIRGHHHDLDFRQNTIGNEEPTDKGRAGILVSADCKGFQSSKNTFQNVKTEVLRQGV